MQFLKQEIPAAPADCESRIDCESSVFALEIFAVTAGDMAQDAMPDHPEQEISPAKNSVLTQATVLMGALPAAIKLVKPPAQRCAGCVIDCAVAVLRDSGAV